MSKQSNILTLELLLKHMFKTEMVMISDNYGAIYHGYAGNVNNDLIKREVRYTSAIEETIYIKILDNQIYDKKGE